MKKDQNDIDQRKLVLYILDEISEAGRHEVEAWLNESQENRRVFDALNKTWLETGRVDNFPRQIDVDDVWNSFSQRLETESSREALSVSRTRRNNRRILRIISAAAAVVILTLVSVTMIRNLQFRTDRTLVRLASQEEVLRDTLTDGSAIFLNKNSTLKIASGFDKKKRRVELAGEAFFDVASDSTKPFVVEAGLGQIRVLGTSFQVKAYPSSNLEVFVEEGRVELTGHNNSGGESMKVILKAGERGIIRYPDGEVLSGDDLKPDDLFWANRKLIFEETKLSLVFDLLKKHYKSQIEIKNENILACLLSATFNNETDEQILAVIAISFDLSIVKEEGKFVISGKGCDNE